jgi:hypothetical protein
MADAKSQAIAREEREQKLLDRLDRLERVEGKLDRLLALLDDEGKPANDENQVPLEVSKEELPNTPTIVPVTAADSDAADDKKAADEKKADKPKNK